MAERSEIPSKRFEIPRKLFDIKTNSIQNWNCFSSSHAVKNHLVRISVLFRRSMLRKKVRRFEITSLTRATQPRSNPTIVKHCALDQFRYFSIIHRRATVSFFNDKHTKHRTYNRVKVSNFNYSFHILA